MEGYYDPIDEKEENTLIQSFNNIYNALLKYRTNKDIIVYRNDPNPKYLEGKTNKFLSTSVTQNGVFEKKPNVAIIIPKNTSGAYIENLSKMQKQREFLLNANNTLRKIHIDDDFAIYEVINDDR